MGICISPTSKSYFIVTRGIGHSKLPMRIDEVFSIALMQCTGYRFFGKCTVCSLPLTWKVTLPLLQSITAPVVFKKGLPRMTAMASSSGISKITKSVKIVVLEPQQAHPRKCRQGKQLICRPFAERFQWVSTYPVQAYNKEREA